MPSTRSSADTKCISEVPGLVKHTSTLPATSVLTRLSAPFMTAPLLSLLLELPITKKSSFHSPVKRFAGKANTLNRNVPGKGPVTCGVMMPVRQPARLAKNDELWPLSAERGEAVFAEADFATRGR